MQQCGESPNVDVIAHNIQKNCLESLKATRIASKIKHDSLLWQFTGGIIKDLLARICVSKNTCLSNHCPPEHSYNISNTMQTVHMQPL